MSINSSNAKVFKTRYGDCERLLSDASNFSIWKMQTEAMLAAYQVKGIVKGLDLRPTLPAGTVIPAVVEEYTDNRNIQRTIITTESSIISPDAALVSAAEKRIADWDAQSEKAYSLLLNTLSVPVQASVQDTSTLADDVNCNAIRMWNAILLRYDITKEQGVATRVRTDFYNDRLQDGERIDAYINRLIGYKNKLALTPLPLPDSEAASKLLSSLTPAWKIYTDTIEVSNYSQSFDLVAAQLRSYSTLVHGTDKNQTAAAATSNRGGRGGYSRGKGRGGRGGSTRGRGDSSRNKTERSAVDKDNKLTCNFCGKTGHKAHNCYAKKKYDSVVKMGEAFYKKDGGSGAGASARNNDQKAA